MEPAGKTVLITGGGSGIGLQIARELVSAGSKVIICGRTLARLEDAREQVPSLAIAQCDVADREQIQALRERCDSEFGGIDVLVNNAGVFGMFDIADSAVSLETQLAEVDIDFNGPLRMVHYFLPGLLNKPESAIVNVSSGLASVPYVAAPVYCATKAGIHSWTRSLRKQLEQTNVKVFELMPPLVETEMVEAVDLSKISPEKLAEAFIKGFKRDRLQITPGQSSQLSKMSRFAPGLIFRLVKQVTLAARVTHSPTLQSRSTDAGGQPLIADRDGRRP